MTVDVGVAVHLCFKQAQPKMCDSPKVKDKVEKISIHFLDPYFQTIKKQTLKFHKS